MDFIDSVLLFLQMRWAFCLASVLIFLLGLYFFYEPFKNWVSFKYDDWIRVRFPFFGLLATAKYVAPEKEDDFCNAEEKLCAIYETHYVEHLDRATFAQRVEFLQCAKDDNHSPLSTPWLFVLVILVAAESLGFSYMLGKWMAMEASENTHVLLMFAIVTVLCIVMVILTHSAGQQWRRTGLLRDSYVNRDRDSARKEYQQIGLDDDQYSDKDCKDYQRVLNRVATKEKDMGSYAYVYITCVAIIVIAVASTWMRYSALEQNLINETTLQQESSNDSADPFAMVLPDEITDSQKSADNKALLEIQSATRQEGMAAFAMLAFIFVITQCVGVGLGIKHSFNTAVTSRQAYDSILGKLAYTEYEKKFNKEDISSLVDERLATLWEKFERKYKIEKKPSNHTFGKYLLKKAREKAENERQKQEIMQEKKALNQEFVAPISQESAPRSQSQSQLAMQKSTPALQIAETPQTPAVPSFEEIKAHLESLNDASKEKAYFQGLPDEAKTTEARALLQERILANI